MIVKSTVNHTFLLFIIQVAHPTFVDLVFNVCGPCSGARGDLKCTCEMYGSRNPRRFVVSWFLLYPRWTPHVVMVRESMPIHHARSVFGKICV